ncbi:MAG: hypothetical protein V4639_11740 [Pseudomonadota bacterium]
MNTLLPCRSATKIAAVSVVLVFSIAATAATAANPYVPTKWTKFVKVEGQREPVPEQWLQDAEARIAYSLKLPDAVPNAVPFDFRSASWRAWIPGKPTVGVQYFNHLCSTEAGEWIFRKEQNVEGLYFARPQNEPTTDVMTDPYGPEMPWIQRIFMVSGNGLKDQGAQFVNPPFYNYRFVEQPRREVDWQKGITEPYIRLFGYTTERARDQNGKLTDHRKQATAMQVSGIPTPSVRYGYTWRGLKRPQDREHGIAGGELLIYDMKTKEVLAVRRQFLIAGRNSRGEGKAMWEVAASCPQVQAHPYIGEFKQFSFNVLQTIEPSKTGK